MIMKVNAPEIREPVEKLAARYVMDHAIEAKAR